MTLDVLISTFGPDGIGRVASMNPPVLEGVRYIVTWQSHTGCTVPPAIAARADFDIHRVGTIGLSHNRNHGLDLAGADICLIADDDITYTSEGLRGVMKAFAEHPSMDIATFRYEGDAPHYYPPAACSLSPWPRGYCVTSFEIAIRRGGRAGALRFDTRFGLGSPLLHCGEEEMFILHARRLGLEMRFFPITIATHPGLTTGRRIVTDPAVYRAQGAVIRFMYPLTWPLRLPLKAWRGYRAGTMQLMPAMRHLTSGALLALLKIRPLWKE